jgi:hypothetical protein
MLPLVTSLTKLKGFNEYRLVFTFHTNILDWNQPLRLTLLVCDLNPIFYVN